MGMVEWLDRIELIVESREYGVGSILGKRKDRC